MTRGERRRSPAGVVRLVELALETSVLGEPLRELFWLFLLDRVVMCEVGGAAVFFLAPLFEEAADEGLEDPIVTDPPWGWSSMFVSSMAELERER